MKKVLLVIFTVQSLIWSSIALANGQLKLAQNHPDVHFELLEMIALINECDQKKIEENMHPQAI